MGTTLGTTAVLLVSGAGLFALVSKALFNEFDQALSGKAATLAATVEFTQSGVDLEFVEANPVEFARTERPEYYQAWASDGAVIARSPSLGCGNLVAYHDLTPTVAKSIVLPNGKAGRLFALKFTVRLDDELPDGSPVPTIWLALARDIDALSATMSTFKTSLVVIGLAAVTVSILVLNWLVRFGLRPAEVLAENIQGIDERTLAMRLDAAHSPAELRPIVLRINEMLERVEEAFDRERAMTANIAHELRTPLAGLRAILDVALTRERDGAEYREAMNECRVICEQLQRLIVNLLSLARLDAGRENVHRQTTDVDQLLRSTWQSVLARAPQRDLSTAWNVVPPILADTDRDKLGVVFSNVFDNAVQYVDFGGLVSVDARSHNGHVIVSIANTGSRISSEQVSHVFERFWRGDEARSNGIHSGLGLALCRTIVERLGGKISAESELGGSFQVNITL